MMSARSGTTPSILVQPQRHLEQCAELFFYEPLAIIPGSPLYKSLATDLRDWEAIRAWANSIADMVQP